MDLLVIVIAVKFNFASAYQCLYHNHDHKHNNDKLVSTGDMTGDLDTGGVKVTTTMVLKVLLTINESINIFPCSFR